MFRKLIALASVAAIAACASTSVTPVSRNQIIINTSAAPACGGRGAQGVAAKMAAVETLRRGFQRFVIVGTSGANNTSVRTTGPTYSTTNTTYRGYGNSVYGTSQTSYGGSSTIVSGSHDASLAVIMLNPGDQGFENGVDARQTLGPKWQEMVERGVNTCSG